MGAKEWRVVPLPLRVKLGNLHILLGAIAL